MHLIVSISRLVTCFSMKGLDCRDPFINHIDLLKPNSSSCIDIYQNSQILKLMIFFSLLDNSSLLNKSYIKIQGISNRYIVDQADFFTNTTGSWYIQGRTANEFFINRRCPNFFYQTAAKIKSKTYRVIFGFPDLESYIFDFLAVFHE